MTHHSSAELDATHPMSSDVPLSDRPLVASDEKTVVSAPTDAEISVMSDAPLSATAQEIRDRLFAPPDGEQNPERGLKIGHFEVEERIGSGGMGAVFRAMDLELSRYVALKVLHPGIAADPSLVARFRNEARACAQLNHDNVARVFFTGEQDGVHYIAYEYADGYTIKELIAQHGRLTQEETVNYAIQATLALSHVSAAGIVHRDIKPSNIILTRQGRIKVVDLGLARRDTTDSIGDITAAGTTLGTFDYIAPEQARDPRTADIRSDIYSLGCTVYHMLTGQPPYPEGTALQKLLDHQGKSPPDPRKVAKDVSTELSLIVQKMMNTDPDRRYQDPGQLLADLLSVAGHLKLRSVPAEGIVWRRMAVTRVRELSGSLFLTGAVLAICVTALIMHFSPGDRESNDAELRAAWQSTFPANVSMAEDSPVAMDQTSTDSTGTGSTTGPASLNQANATAGSTTSPDRVAAEDSATADSGSKNPGSEPQTPEPAANGAGTTPTEPVTGAPTTGPFRIIRADRSEERVSSLNVAWDSVRSGDVILLDFDGPLGTPTRSLGRPTRPSQSLTIRAAENRRPILEFRGADSLNRLFYLSNNLSLSIIGIDFRIILPSDVSDQWALFQCIGANRVSLQDCTIEVSNPTRASAAVFRFTDAATESSEESETSIELENVCIRGATDVFVISGQTGGTLKAHQCGFALDGSLIRNLGRMGQGGSPTRKPGQFLFDIQHTSSILAQAAIRMRDSDDLLDADSLGGGIPERELPGITVHAYSNVIASLMPEGVMVVSEGNAYLQEMQDLLTWQGSHNLYHQFGVYWELNSGGVDQARDQMRFERWERYWADSLSGYEDDADEFAADLWIHGSHLVGITRSELGRLPVSSFELDRSMFFSGETTAPYSLDRTLSVPGISAGLRRFPEPVDAVLVPAEAVTEPTDED